MSELSDMLRSARQKKCVTLYDASRATHIKETYLGALEDGDFGLLPGPAYVTGFLRNYATFLGLHPDDVVQEYYTIESPPKPTVKAASRLLANGFEHYHRARLLWGLGLVILLLSGGYAIKQYNDTYAHPYSAPLLTPANLGVPVDVAAVHHKKAVTSFTVHLQAVAPVWVRVTADSHKVFQGILRPRMHHKQWTSSRSLYVLTYNGAKVKVTYDGRALGPMAARPGLIVDVASTAGWQHAS